MGDLGSGSGSSYPTALDTQNTPEVNSPNAGKTKARAEVPNDLAAAVIAIETELGTDPAGTLTNVKTFLQTEHGTNGTHDATKVAMLAGAQTITGNKTYSGNNTHSGAESFTGVTTAPLSLRDQSRELVIIPNVTNPTYQVDVDADEITLQDSSNISRRFTSINLTADISASGANGLDTGSEAADTWYYVWVIAKADGTVAGLLSTSSTAPTMPSGYTFKALVGVVRNDSSSDFVSFRQEGRNYYYTTNVQAFRLTGATLNTWTSQAVSSAYPPISKKIYFAMQGQSVYHGVSPVSSGDEGHYSNHGAGASVNFGGVFADTWQNASSGGMRYADPVYYFTNNVSIALYATGFKI